MAEQRVADDLLLDVRNVCVDYYAANGAVHAVRDVNLTLRRGEILGLAGESGCGKSTLAFAIARLLRPPAEIIRGEVLYYPRPHADRKGSMAQNRRGRNSPQEDVIDILSLSPSQLRQFRWNELSVVFQSAMNALNPVMTVGTQIIDAIKAHRPDMGPDACRKRALELLDLVGIAGDRIRSYPHELSGGMRQRAVIAIALALNPEVIIMDEPTTALDVVVQREILELISNLCKEFNTALIFITHDLSLLLELSDRLAIMYAGKMIEKASSEDVYKHPRHPYSYGLLNSFPTLHGPRRKMVGIPGSPPDLRVVSAGCPFAARCPMVFEPCHTVTPELAPATSDNQEQLAACHLYNPTYSQKLPGAQDFAKGYEALAERSLV
ncbi:dipeptide/oligopeptide/nickel ABC transporter ATP-binding protein [Dictyobacter sp. S3.2.2.5]|uniref:Dipeptide/oligopeptide/nickel ABC transporter ATP-binding protein n=1 Tax=Dictyobacter halimunensis TaxID=3026934 RepID=A0ABQ6G4I1_9CHLR|nr:dipeptide/oligopeptide/nickel ABC transporter ATP-binding protein [Dictyobacter sp. S3.2.2.5]